MSFEAPVVTVAGSTDVTAPLVVLLHGRGADESSILALSEQLPEGPAYAAVRAPITEGGGYAWFENRGIGRPVEESLAETIAWFRKWLDEVAPAGRPVIPIGFSGGAAFAGGLVLSDPARFAGVAVLNGTLPWDAGLPVDVAHLAGLPVFLVHGEQDFVIPADLTRRTWDYLTGDSGSATLARRDPGGHVISHETVAELADWLSRRLHHLETVGAALVGRAETVSWPTLPEGLPARVGARPLVSWAYPQQQFSDQSPHELQTALFDRITRAEGVSVGESQVAVPGSRAFFLADAAGPAEAFVVAEDNEFAHLHPLYDTSLHLTLPADLAADAIAQGWAQPHMHAGTRKSPGFVLVYGPRTEAEVEVVAGIVEASRRYALG
ncbi:MULTISPECIES: luciferase family protein [unclassified Nocardioides]|uniref:luciferase domain-containing protein n=1 Tax=unclassified Nocardioides TaxID=2615069 RepID=UPI0006FE80EE|nr:MULTISPECIES: luciferase family protein [unclassified Nocardioides]KQY62588.1 phospholipase [Nocardioides sp. Root140]KQZ76012.1 phospholipase [Nocardioides sp. Root151]KRF15085.1 phospholipase [Nocardioides sp. Soil796]